MASNDEQIELLIRRFGTRSGGPNGGGSHLDADEMNAFAEGALPQPARARYVSHLAECDQCRKQVADLAITSGAITRAEQAAVDRPARVGLWAALGGLFALPMLRYAALAVLLVSVGGVAFFALRPRTEAPASLVAKNEGEQADRSSAVKPAMDSNGGLTNSNGLRAETPNSVAPPAASQAPAPASQPPAVLGGKPEEVRPADTTTVPAEPMKELAKAPEIAEKKAAETVTVAKSPYAYSPVPPGETQAATGAQSQTGNFAKAPSGGPRQQQQQVTQADKAQAERGRDAEKDARLDDANRKSDLPGLARANDDKLKGGPSRNMDNAAINNRTSTEAVRVEAPKTEASDTEDRRQTRSAGGHKFRRQGNAWVDQKFKSAMSLKNVARGSDEFSSLDSGLRSIAQQVSGEVIVVWKGKAYLFK